MEIYIKVKLVDEQPKKRKGYVTFLGEKFLGFYSSDYLKETKDQEGLYWLKNVSEKEMSDLIDLDTCESCGKKFDTEKEEYGKDDNDNYFCEECYKELAPVMKADYEELKKQGLIDDEGA